MSIQPGSVPRALSTRIIWLSDIQARLLPSLADSQPTVDRIKQLISKHSGSEHFVLTEQLKDKLGPTDESILEALRSSYPNYELFPKSAFSAHDVLLPVIDRMKADEVLIAGVETHICVFQTALYLTYYRPHLRVIVPEDLVASSSFTHKSAALRLLDRARNVQVDRTAPDTTGLKETSSSSPLTSLLLFKLRHPDTTWTVHRPTGEDGSNNSLRVLDVVETALKNWNKAVAAGTVHPVVPEEVAGVVVKPADVTIYAASFPPSTDDPKVIGENQKEQISLALLDSAENNSVGGPEVIHLTAEMLLFGLTYDAKSPFFKASCLSAVKAVKQALTT